MFKHRQLTPTPKILAILDFALDLDLRNCPFSPAGSK